VTEALQALVADALSFLLELLLLLLLFSSLVMQLISATPWVMTCLKKPDRGLWLYSSLDFGSLTLLTTRSRDRAVLS
jgi:hypothetical protein